MRIVLTGASGQLGGYLLPRLQSSELEVDVWSRRLVDLGDPCAIEKALEASDPEVILHVAAMSTIEGVRTEPERARLVNVESTQQFADWCRDHNRRLVFTSTDLVFGGSKSWNREDDPTGPLMAYGQTKLEAERAVLETPRGIVARLSLLYGPSRSPNRQTSFDRMVAGLRRSEPQTFFEDEFRTPLDLATAADILVRLSGSNPVGLLHVGGAARMSRYELARRIAQSFGLDSDLVRGNRQSEVVFAEPRPVDVSLDTTRLLELWPDLRRPTVEEAVLQTSIRREKVEF